MKKNTIFFVIFSLVLCLGVTLSYVRFQGYFAQHGEAQVKIELLSRALEAEKEKNDLLSFQLRDLQNSLSAVIADVPAKMRSPKMASLSAVLREPASIEPLDLSGVLLAEGKKKFQEKKFDEAIEDFSKLNRQFPLSAYLPESLFFVVEAHYQKSDYRQAVKVIDQMITQFPDQELTGMAMLRLGQISELQGQKAEAFEIFTVVERNFSQFPKVVKSAQVYLKSSERIQ